MPFDGRVREKSVGIGQYVTAGTHLGRVFSTATVEIRLPLTDAQLAELNLPMGFMANDFNAPEVQFKALVGRHEHIWTGHIVRINASVDQQTRLIYAIAEVEDPYGSGADDGAPIAVGMFVNAEIAGVSSQSALGLTLADVNRQVRQAYFGEEVQRLARNGQDVRVKVRYPLASRRSIESLNNFRVRTSDGRELPLLSVADLDYAPGIKNIIRWNGNRAARVSADLKENVRDDIMEDLDENFFPEWEKRYPGIVRGAVGQAEGEKRFIREVMGLYLIAFFAMYSMLAVAFRSYWQPILILVAMPFAFMGAIFGHALLGLTMAIFSYFGIAAAAGVVVNDNLVLMDYCNRLRDKGMAPEDAIVEAGVARFRPILLTSVTTIVGLMPMMLERSMQAAFLKPVVVALAFGVFFAFFVTLLMVPSLYGIGLDIAALSRRIKRWIRSKVPGGAQNEVSSARVE